MPTEIRGCGHHVRTEKDQVSSPHIVAVEGYSMRIRVSHRTIYRYDTPATGVVQMLRMTPGNHETQYVVDWRIDLSEDARLTPQEDAFGNLTHAFSVDGPISQLTLLVEGEVETQDTNGVVRGAVERFPASLFLRETPLTLPSPELLQWARALGDAGRPVLERLHALLAAVHDKIVYDTDATHAATTASEAFAAGRGVCQDLAHIFIAAARSLGVPSRYIGGYLCRDDQATQHAGHAWAEAFVPDLGWIAFDPAHGICITDAYIRVAAGLDYLGAAPVRGSRYGGGGEAMSVELAVIQAQAQVQSQH
jgi:transglutaminase-like putative cysteine protease